MHNIKNWSIILSGSLFGIFIFVKPTFLEYGSGLFPDFYDWLEYILNKASLNDNCDFYIKSHPN